MQKRSIDPPYELEASASQLVLKLLGQAFGRCIAPRSHQRPSHCLLIGRQQMHFRAAAGAPSAIERLKDAWLLANELPLLRWRQLHHAPKLLWAKRSEDLSTNTEVRMSHVLPF